MGIRMRFAKLYAGSLPKEDEPIGFRGSSTLGNGAYTRRESKSIVALSKNNTQETKVVDIPVGQVIEKKFSEE